MEGFLVSVFCWIFNIFDIKNEKIKKSHMLRLKLILSFRYSVNQMSSDDADKN